ncbi:oligosaccharyl transferase subunit [Lotmaria passim]
MPTQRQRGRDAKADTSKSPVAQTDSCTQDTKQEDASSSSDETYLFNCKAIPYSVCTKMYAGLMLGVILYALRVAYTIRLISVQTYGYIIHEFDPWFNYRAAEYMSEHGWTAFFHWFDYMSWYPLGRPVGSTTYPGLQFTAVAIHRTLAALGVHMSLNDVCVLIPAWFGSIATLLVALMAYEVSESLSVTAVASLSFAIVPAHLMRSMAGEFDNECIALAAMLLTFYLWTRSLRTPSSWPIGALVGVAYGYMVAAWGGYIFVLNMVALHAGVAALVDWARNTYSPALLRSYALFYVVGTALATRVPPVGMAPFHSLEQLGALGVLIFLCGLQVCEVLRRRAAVAVRSRKNMQIRVRVFGVMAGVAALVVAVLAPTGYFGPLSSRVRALFVQHTLTGNPLVDSVAEHQPSTPEAFWAFLHVCSVMWGMGVALMVLSMPFRYTPAKLFWILNSAAAYYFSLRMSRLVLLSGPPACLCSGYFVGAMIDVATRLTFWDSETTRAKKAEQAERQAKVARKTSEEADVWPTSLSDVIEKSSLTWSPRFILCLSMWALVTAIGWNLAGSDFPTHAGVFSEQASNPMIVFNARVRDQRTNQPRNVIVDDYLASYLWLRQHTPRSARILAWWDYGYQITGIGNRTSLADGNTWNHEHIATIGKMLTSPVVEAHSLVRHMADYVLIWAGQNKDDLMKSPHMARIGNSVYRDICPNDPLCRHFGFFDREYRKPTPTMRASLLYNLHERKIVPGVEVDPALFQEVYTSKYGLVRIYKVMNVSRESKRWVADPANRVCNPPGSWICPGQYPPAKEIQDMLAHRVDFEQLENFNRKRNDSYYRAYMARSRMAGEA